MKEDTFWWLTELGVTENSSIADWEDHSVLKFLQDTIQASDVTP